MSSSAVTVKLKGVVTCSEGQTCQGVGVFIPKVDVRTGTSVAVKRFQAVVRTGGDHFEM